MPIQLNVYEYDDYRKLLLALIQERKKNRLPFSYRWFSKKAGFTSPNILNLVIKGKRHLSPESAEKVIEIFHLKKDEGLFFKKLIEFQKAKSLSEKERCARDLLRTKKYQNQHPLSSDQFAYYSDWFNIPIRELFTLKDPPNTAEEIMTSLIPTVPKLEVEKAIAKLIKLDLIQQVANRYKLKNENITTGNKFANFGVVNFHKKMIQLGAEALDRFKGEHREVSSVSIGLSQEKFLVAKKMLEDLRDQFILLSEEDQNKEIVYQINFQFFPLSKKKEK